MLSNPFQNSTFRLSLIHYYVARLLPRPAAFSSHIYTKPLGKHVIFVCDSISCWVAGYECVRDYMSKSLGVRLGETTADGQFTLMPIACLGICEHAPAMLIDGELYTDLNPEKIDEILKRYE